MVREALAGEDDSEDHEWAVHVVEEMVADESGPVECGLRDRFSALAEEHGGWYDPEPRPDASAADDRGPSGRRAGRPRPRRWPTTRRT